ncbi:hypothetical protein VA596_24995 [Amycolatopsis sp., V23-08]|uniref:Uncharacterized protein n=1 Tax=Amycolatopsis heterodermiae TaxID=3110235 RepID=A0ABU5RB27_9PSEU|nr:hypothetical protein [Amycolatopsis sp., V23-08]MEA5362815.1 hypothetical protein [Amycolatopsis sp., V23-08]
MSTGLLSQVLEAHGGLERWRAVQTIRARVAMGGPSWAARGVEGLLADLDVTVDLREQRTVFTGFTGPGRRGVYTPDRVAIEDADDVVLQERHAPRASFGGEQWDPLHALYFAGYGLWNYLTTPYLLTLPGVRTEELPDDGPWRRLRVTFPPRITTHCAEQTFHFDESGLQRRVDYAPHVMGNRPVAHMTEVHKAVSGLVFPTHRFVLPLRDGRPAVTPIITVDLADLSVEGGPA